MVENMGRLVSEEPALQLGRLRTLADLQPQLLQCQVRKRQIRQKKTTTKRQKSNKKRGLLQICNPNCSNARWELQDYDALDSKLDPHLQGCKMSQIWQIYLCNIIGKLGWKVKEKTQFCKIRNFRGVGRGNPWLQTWPPLAGDLGPEEGCPRCGGRVHAAEGVTAAGATFHRSVFCHLGSSIPTLIGQSVTDSLAHWLPLYDKKKQKRQKRDLYRFALLRCLSVFVSAAMFFMTSKDVLYVCVVVMCSCRSCHSCAQCGKPIEIGQACDGPDREVYCNQCYAR